MSSVSKILSGCQVLDDVIPDLLPGGGISILAGAPNVGKTAFLAGLIRDLQLGRPIFGRQPAPLPGLGYVNVDRGWAKGAGMWLDRAGVTDLPHYSLADDASFNPKRLRKKWERVDVFASLVDGLQLPPRSLVICDPVSLFLGGNLLDYDSCMTACLEIRAYLRLRQYTLLALAHAGKLKADKSERYVRTTDQILGSTAIPGFSDAILHLASPEELEQPYYQLTWHPHGAPAESFLLERNEQGLFIPYSDVTELSRTSAVLKAIPATGESISFELILVAVVDLPCSRRTLIRILKALVDTGVIVKVAKGLYRRRNQ